MIALEQIWVAFLLVQGDLTRDGFQADGLPCLRNGGVIGCPQLQLIPGESMPVLTTRRNRRQVAYYIKLTVVHKRLCVSTMRLCIRK